MGVCPRNMSSYEYIDKITLLHQVDIPRYFMRKMHGQTTLKSTLYIYFATNYSNKQTHIKRLRSIPNTEQSYMFQRRGVQSTKVASTNTIITVLHESNVQI